MDYNCDRHASPLAPPLSRGMGDLQRGERCAQIDYILQRAIGVPHTSYDIACQWQLRRRTGRGIRHTHGHRQTS
ncbi:hypothetical protein C8J57DRAFT_1528256 [Mycena rebaudengoi]|nr:hypothetical protein C8J57DRAFT_1528256 [Mycena rebaudengoi]